MIITIGAVRRFQIKTLGQKYNEIDCVEWIGSKDKDGYGRFSVNRIDYKAHRVSYAIHNKIYNIGFCVLHSCDNPPCYNPYHLFAGTQQDNTRDRNKKGRQAKGCSINTNKLTVEQVLEIRAKYKTGRYTYQQLADEYHVNTTATIGFIIRRVHWKHIPPRDGTPFD